MRYLRSTLVLRLFVVSALLSLLPSLVAPMARVGRHAGNAYADWLRTQLQEAPGAAFDAAVDEALAASPRSLNAFLQAFIEAYEDRAALAHAFAITIRSEDDLLDALSQRYSRLVGEAVVPELMMKASQARIASTERSVRAVLALADHTNEVALRVHRQALVRASALYIPQRLLTTIQALGP